MINYQIKNNLSQVGYFPQTSIDRKNEYIPPNLFPDFQIEDQINTNVKLRPALLNDKANLTDLISNASYSMEMLLVSEEAKNLISTFSLPEHTYFDFIVRTQQGVIHNYYGLYFINYENQDHFEMDKMPFKLILKETREVIKSDIYFKSYLDYYNKYREDINSEHFLLPNKIVLKPTILFDVINIVTPFMNLGYYCNDEVSKSIQEYRLSGFKFVPIPKEFNIDPYY